MAYRGNSRFFKKENPLEGKTGKETMLNISRSNGIESKPEG